MALVTCLDCKREISDLAPTCPGCGRPMQVSVSIHASSSAPREERTLFEDERVKVTTSRAVFGGKTTYAMANITSVRSLEEPRPHSHAILGVLLVVLGGGCANLGATTVGAVEVLLGLAILLTYALIPSKHWVIVGTAGSETRAVDSRDPLWTKAVVTAINEAIVSRG